MPKGIQFTFLREKVVLDTFILHLDAIPTFLHPTLLRSLVFIDCIICSLPCWFQLGSHQQKSLSGDWRVEVRLGGIPPSSLHTEPCGWHCLSTEASALTSGQYLLRAWWLHPPLACQARINNGSLPWLALWPCTIPLGSPYLSYAFYMVGCAFQDPELLKQKPNIIFTQLSKLTCHRSLILSSKF